MCNTADIIAIHPYVNDSAMSAADAITMMLLYDDITILWLLYVIISCLMIVTAIVSSNDTILVDS